MIITLLLFIWLTLMLRSGFAEYQYYQSVKTLEPKVWEQLGSPRWLKVPMVFVSPKNESLLKAISNETIQQFSRQHRRAGLQFLSFIVVSLVLVTLFFKFS